MSMLNAGSRVSRLGDTMTGELGMESTGGAKHKLGFVAGQGIMRLLSDLGSVDISAALRAAFTINCKSNSGDGLFYRIAVGEACVFRNTGFAFEMLYAPSGAAGAVCTFTQTFQFSTSGVMTIGTVPISRMRRTEASASNAGVVTALGTSTSLVTVDLGTVSVGDRIMVDGYAFGAKGVTAGRVSVSVSEFTGTSTTVALSTQDGVYASHDSAASSDQSVSVSGILRVTVAGTLVLGLFGASSGSNWTIQPTAAQISALVLKDG